MKESEYKQLPEFQNLPLYDEGDPRCSSIELPEKEGPGGTAWLTVYEANDLKTAQEYLLNPQLVPKGGIRFWESERMIDSDVLAYFWEKKKS